VTPLDAYKSRLIAMVPVVDGKTIFAGTDADIPTTGSFLTIIETGGESPIGTHNEGHTALRRPGFQVTARATDYRDTSALIQLAYNASRASNVLIGDVYFLTIRPEQEPFGLPLDKNGRSRMAFNVATTRRG
jgi:hypothetical protein